MLYLKINTITTRQERWSFGFPSPQFYQINKNNSQISILFKSINMNIRSLAEFCHISQQKDIRFVLSELLGYGFKLIGCMKSFWENHIGSSINIRNWTLYTLFQSINSLSICPSTNHKLAIWYFITCLFCDSYFLDHLLWRNQFFSKKMATSFWKNLILNMKTSSSSIEELMNGSCTHFSFTKTGIGINKNR